MEKGLGGFSAIGVGLGILAGWQSGQGLYGWIQGHEATELGPSWRVLFQRTLLCDRQTMVERNNSWPLGLFVTLFCLVTGLVFGQGGSV